VPVGVRLEVLEHLVRLLGAGEEAVIDLRREPYDPDVVSERIERRHEIVLRVRAAAHGEVATVRQLGSGAERGSHGSAELGDVPGVDDARCRIHLDSASVRPSGPLRVNNGDAMMPALIAGIGLGVLPEFFLREAVEFESSRLERLLPDWSIPLGADYWVTPPEGPLPKRVEVLRDL
jgi:DNA-binding transcriptional LysR family regulator